MKSVIKKLVSSSITSVIRRKYFKYSGKYANKNPIQAHEMKSISKIKLVYRNSAISGHQ